MPLPALVAVAALFGSFWGSFAGVLVARVPTGGDAVRGRSRCDACGGVLGWRDLVPIVSWLALRGRCRHCGASVSSRWTWIEVATAASFALIAAVVADPWRLALLAPFAAILLALTLIDLEHRRLPNAIVYPSVIVAAIYILIARALGGGLDPAGAAVGLVLYGGTLLLIALVSRGGMGVGDVKLAGLIGLVVGAVDLPSVGVAAGAAFLFGGVAGIVALLRGADRRSALPFGPMLAAGALVAVLVGPSLADAYLGLLA